MTNFNTKLSADGSTVGVQIYNKPKVVNDVDVYLHGSIGELYEYENLFNCLRSVEEGDTVKLWVSNVGGNLNTTLEIVQALQDCKAETVTIVTGECHSGASIIALSSQNLIIGDFATMMIHNASYGTAGKASDIHSMVMHSHDVLTKLINKFYEGFLTPEEIEDVIQGKEFWFDADQIRERLEIRSEYQSKLIEKQIASIQEEIKEVPVKKTRKKS